MLVKPIFAGRIGTREKIFENYTNRNHAEIHLSETRMIMGNKEAIENFVP